MGMIVNSANKLTFTSAAMNIVFDGNSLVSGVGASSSPFYLPAQLQALVPINGNITISNVGVSGNTISDMRARGSADALYASGKKNILLVWEGTNSVTGNMTGNNAAIDMAGYCSDRLAGHSDWIIVLMTTLPRFDMSAGSYTVANGNTQLSAYDTYLKANFKAMGAAACVDVREAGIFTYTGTSMSGTMSPYMADSIHCNNAGYGLIARYCAATLSRIPLR